MAVLDQMLSYQIKTKHLYVLIIKYFSFKLHSYIQKKMFNICFGRL